MAQAMRNQKWVVSGSLDGWGDELIADVQRIVFLDTSTEVRLRRLESREATRSGNRILPGGSMYEQHVKFMSWAESYNRSDQSGRNRQRHEAWLNQHQCKVLRLDGNDSLEELVVKVLS